MYNNKDFYNARHVVNYNAIFNFISCVRDAGKTTAFAERAILRAVKKGKFTYWVRRTESERDKTKDGFINKRMRKLLNSLGFTEDKVKTRGNRLMLKIGKHWKTVIQFLALAEWTAGRSVENADFDNLVFDEFAAKPERLAFYRGNEAHDFCDIVVTKARLHFFQAFCIGNEESINNVYYNYFNIPTPPENWEGIKTYEDGTILIEVRKTPPEKARTQHYNRLVKALSRTPYGSYMTEGKPEGLNTSHVRKRTKNARFWTAFDFGAPLSVYFDGYDCYICAGVDKTQYIFVPALTNKYQRATVFSVDDKKRLGPIKTAFRRNSVYFDCPATAEHFQKLEKIIM